MTRRLLSGASAKALAQSKDLFRRATATLKRIAGMPDYGAYVAHLREQHPGCPIPTRREYYDLYLEQRYSGGGSRCC
ncbi:MAG: YbdD/YjiX family protein [Gemmatimonadales bacterium]